MTTRDSHRALRRAFFPVLEANGFAVDRRSDGVAATRDRGGYHDEVHAHVAWTFPRDIIVTVGVRSDSLKDFLAAVKPGAGFSGDSGNLNLRTFEPGADPRRPHGMPTGWKFDGSAPSEGLLAEITLLLDATCKRLESICDEDTHAVLIRDHAYYLSRRRPAPVLAGALAHAGRFQEASRICRAAMESDEAALAQNVSYAPQARPLLQSILDYCEARS